MTIRKRAGGLGRRVAPAIVALVATAIIGSDVLAAPPPLALSPIFTDREFVPSSASRKIESNACVADVVEITDSRRFPDLVGVVGKRAVRAPADSGAWLRSVLSGLKSRGVDTRFSGTDGAPGTLKLRVRLEQAGLTESVGTFTGNVVVAIDATGPGGRSLSRSFRGRTARTGYWTGRSDGKLQSAMDGAFVNLLDTIAPELKLLCGMSATA